MKRQLYGIYDAHGGILGELVYVLGKITGLRHCYLCDITHKFVRQNPVWTELMSGLGNPIKLLHINEQTSTMADFTKGKTPCIILETESSYLEILSADDIRACKGGVQVFGEKLSIARSNICITNQSTNDNCPMPEDI